MHKLMLLVATISGAQLLTGCAWVKPRTDPASLKTYDKMTECMYAADENPLRAKCDERFKDVQLSGEFEQLKFVPGGTYASLVVRGGASISYGMPAATNYMSCWLDGPQDKDRLAALSAGDRVTVKATLHGRTVKRNEGGGLLWAALELRPCEIVSVKAASKR